MTRAARPRTVKASGKPQAGAKEGRDRRLSSEEIVEAALRLARRDGVDGLTMRSLASELGVTVAAAYYYVESKDKLLELVADEVVRSIVTPATTSVDWETEFREAARETARAIQAFPGLYGVLASRPFTRSARASIDKLLSDLLKTGFDERAAAMAYQAYLAYLMGFCMLQDIADRAPGRRSFPTPTDDYPVLAQVSTAASDVRSEDYLEFGLDVLIDGLRAAKRRAVAVQRGEQTAT